QWERQHGLWGGGECRGLWSGAEARFDVARRQHVAFGEQARALDGVAQLADVARPRSGDEQALGRKLDAGDRLLEALAELADERRREVRDVLAPIAKRRQ